VLFPVRTVRVVVHILDALSQAFVRKPMLTAKSSKPEDENVRWVTLMGKVVDAEKELNKRKNTEYDLVPKDWSLVRFRNGEEEVVEHHVAAFDLDGRGGVVWTNGSRIVHRSGEGRSNVIAKGKLIERVVSCG